MILGSPYYTRCFAYSRSKQNITQIDSLYRTEHMLSADRLEMERQRSACLQYAEEHSWTVLREFWAREDHMDDPLMELCAGVKRYSLFCVFG